ncbi:MAG: hypothetical protein AAFY26_00780 [Cyanobacteria bacterium J06638_22]
MVRPRKQGPKKTEFIAIHLTPEELDAIRAKAGTTPLSIYCLLAALQRRTAHPIPSNAARAAYLHLSQALQTLNLAISTYPAKPEKSEILPLLQGLQQHVEKAQLLLLSVGLDE